MKLFWYFNGVSQHPLMWEQHSSNVCKFTTGLQLLIAAL